LLTDGRSKPFSVEADVYKKRCTLVIINISWLQQTINIIFIFIKVKVSPILVGQMLGNGADPVLGSQPAGNSMQVINLVVCCHHLPLGLPQRHTCVVINPAVSCHYFPSQPLCIAALRPVSTYTAGGTRGVRNLLKILRCVTS